ncbi:prostaglandin E2 receptor EP4 subtype-like [Mya arenaria]|uniref:prostaglandin E2 receptor EP4 subtype-like n=1 Tax=Mya arenaria TaxID=6604 RepID=UPI0022E3B490|nr:prostaglandin E2 receptor EP4 subtype-like [Mya arenaria]
MADDTYSFINTNMSNLITNSNEDVDVNASSGTFNASNGNMTSDVQSDPLISFTVPALMFSFGVFGNILAIAVLFRSSNEHKRTVFYRLVGALACTDLFGTCATSPITLAVYANKFKWVGGDALCQYESFMLIFAGYSTVFIIGAMAVDRLLAILCPFFYDQHITTRRAVLGICSLWAFAAFLGLLPILGLGENVKQFPGTWCFFTFVSSEIKNQIFAYMYASIGLSVISMTIVFNFVVTWTLLKMRRKAANISHAKRQDSELQMMMLLLGIIIIFSTCWCPFLIRVLINQSHQRQIDVRADLHALRLASFNQILDPWVYILFRKELFERVFGCMKSIVSSVSPCKCADDDVAYEERMERSETFRKTSSQVKFLDLEKDNDQLEDDIAIHEIQSTDINNKAETKSSETQRDQRPLQRKFSNGSSRRSLSKTKYITSDVDEESVPLTEVHSCHINLKHSACLFCLSNHPKSVVKMNKDTGYMAKSLEILNEKDSENPCTNYLSVIQDMSKVKRGSIHLSLEDVSGTHPHAERVGSGQMVSCHP